MKLLRNLFVSCVAIWALVVLSGCATDSATMPPAGGAGADGSQRVPETGEYIRPGEQLTIELLDIPSPTKVEQAVADDGTITLPLLKDRVPAAGKKVSELQDAIHNLYVGTYYQRITVNIKRDNRYFWVRGEVKNSGQRPWTGEMTVTKAVASAGDFTEYADKKNIEIIRGNGAKQRVNWKKALENPQKYDLPIYPGDTVHVPLKFY